MTARSIRLRIEIDSNDFEFTSDVETKFWFLLDCHELHTIESLKRNLLNKILFYQKQRPYHYQATFSSIHLSLDNFELPAAETTSLLRENDRVIIHLVTATNELTTQYYPALVNHKKRKQNNPSNESSLPIKKNLIAEDLTSQQSSNYTACLIGTSMVKHINVKTLFSNETKCFFKSISGGLIKGITSCLTARELLLAHCKLFIITAGSNDIDSGHDVQVAINDFTNLAKYLHSKYPDAKVIINKLIPRTRTKFTKLADFEIRRVEFNQFLEEGLQFLPDHVIVTHNIFEDKLRLDSLLSDGVHLSPLYGVGPYVAQIQKYIS